MPFYDVFTFLTVCAGSRYGPGPTFYVEMHLTIHDRRAHGSSTDGTVLIQTASIETMPYSVYHFLELVSHKAYDGTSFHVNAQHLMQAGPSAIVERMEKLKREDPSLASLIFQEYSPQMPHKQYTLGFPKRPGGPDFYVNMGDNSGIHGPGGQARHYGETIGMDADPCFARVVEGFNMVDGVRVRLSEDESQEAVMINSMRVVDQHHLSHRLRNPSHPQQK